MKVFRIEHKTKKRYKTTAFIGPYGVSGGFLASEWTSRIHSAKTGQPAPEEDGIKTFKQDYICGFESLESLHSWFSSEEIFNLKKLGFKIVSYSVSEENILFGKSQLMFRAEGRRRIIS